MQEDDGACGSLFRSSDSLTGAPGDKLQCVGPGKGKCQRGEGREGIVGDFRSWLP